MDKGFDHLKIALSIGVQRMVRSDLATSGIMFSIDTETGFKDAVLINAAYGLGENVPISSNQRIDDTSCVTTAIEHLTMWDIRVPSVIVNEASFLGRHRVCQQPVRRLGAGLLESPRSSRL